MQGLGFIWQKAGGCMSVSVVTRSCHEQQQQQEQLQQQP
jgi:hypothetical protein